MSVTESAASLRELADAAKSSRLSSRSPLDSYFAPGSRNRADLTDYLGRLKERGVRLTALQVYFDLQRALPAFPVAGDACRRWLTRNLPAELLPWK